MTKTNTTTVLSGSAKQAAGRRSRARPLWTLLAGLLLCAQVSPAAAEAALEAPGAKRQFLTVETLAGESEVDLQPLHYGHFMPVGEASAAPHAFSGILDLPAFTVSSDQGRGLRSFSGAVFPGLRATFFSREGQLIPVDQGLIRLGADGPWDIILSPGRVWAESGDAGWSRASFPFTLVDQRWGASRNGVATFLYDDQRVSTLRLQIAQEASPNAQFDFWTQIEVGYEPAAILNAAALWTDFVAERAARLRLKPWSDLEARHESRWLERFDGTGNASNITVSGLLLDGVFYLKPCRTRLGPYPYCAEMRHAVYSQSKTLGALIAMLRLTEKYGPEVWEERILDYVPLAASHQGWAAVTFRHALDMTTGIGDIVPQRVSDYVDTDFSPLSLQVMREPTIKAKLAVMSRFEDYPWGPGEVFRYRTADTFILSLAMDRFLKSREGPEASLRTMLEQEVFAPLKLGPLPMRESREPQAERRVPLLGAGMLPTFDQVLRLAQLLQNGGAWEGQQILHKDLTLAAVDHRQEVGLPTGWRYPEGGEAHYLASLWRTPHRAEAGCRVYLPVMAGYGGNYLLLLPGGGLALRFADGDDNASSTWTSYEMRRAADAVKPFC